jgi:hypothetical protein
MTQEKNACSGLAEVEWALETARSGGGPTLCIGGHRVHSAYKPRA